MSSRVIRRFASWIALVAILAVTFMPTVTMAFSGTHWNQDVCSADTPSQGPGGEHHTLDHCPYCALHADVALPPLPLSSVALHAVNFRELPTAFLQAPRATGVWSTFQPRAPPIFA